MKRFLALSMVALFAAPHVDAGVLDKKGMKDVKKVALVSFYTPKRVWLAVNREGGGWTWIDPSQDKTGEGLGEQANWGGKEQSEADIRALYESGLKIFQTQLAAVDGWAYVPFPEAAKSPAYQGFNKKEEPKTEPEDPNRKKGKWDFLKVKPLSPEEMGAGPGMEAPVDPFKDQAQMFVARDMRYIPIEALNDGVKRFGNDPLKVNKQAIAKIAQDLNVDAVAIVHMVLSHRYGKAAAFKLGDNVKAIPRVYARLVLVNKDGKTVGDTGSIRTKLLDEFEGDSVSMIKNNRMRLEAPEVRTSFETAMSGAAEKMKDVLSAALAKLK